MAHIDNLIESIKDPQLRAALRAEYDKVTKNRRLGLVFDRHLPESVTLPGFAIRDGEKVQVLTDGTDDPLDVDGTGLWTVTSLDAGTAHLLDGEGHTRNVPVDRLVATREFGDPIYPGLASTGRVIRGGGTDGDDGGKPFHTVINAENHHALEALLFAYEGQVDAIYIDPPYNTGARDWKYNNDYVDDTDPYRHSKWLSFIERRLLLAKRLLNPSGSVLIVTIDEKEYLRLGLLMEQLFPAAAIEMVTSVISAKGVARFGQFSRVEEYIFTVRIGAQEVGFGETNMLDNSRSASAAVGKPVDWLGLRRREPTARRGARPKQFYPVFVDTSTGRIHSIGDYITGDVDRHGVPVPAGTFAVWPLLPDGTEGLWGITPDTARNYLTQGFLRSRNFRPSDGRVAIQYLTSGTVAAIASGDVTVQGFDDDGSVIATHTAAKGVIPKRVWNHPAHNAESGGTKVVATLLPGRRFPFPKSLYAVEDTLRFFVADKPNAVVLDFFAGSGTTAHAVMRLNRQDGGRRRAILVTNNEVSADEQAALRARGLKPGDHEWEALGICDYITKPRIAAAITGRTPSGDPVKGEYRFTDEFPVADGFAENAEFFTLTYEDATLVSLGRRFEAIAPLLWLRAGAVGERIDTVSEDGWSIPAGAVYGVLFDTLAWGEFVAAAAKREDLTHAFIVTDSLVEYQQIVAKLPPTLKTTRLYADYLRSFAINTAR